MSDLARTASDEEYSTTAESYFLNALARCIIALDSNGTSWSYGGCRAVMCGGIGRLKSTYLLLLKTFAAREAALTRWYRGLSLARMMASAESGISLCGW